MTVHDLNREQLDELKMNEAMWSKECEKDSPGISYGELITATEMADEIIYKRYEGTIFSEDDFSCSI